MLCCRAKWLLLLLLRTTDFFSLHGRLLVKFYEWHVYMMFNIKLFSGHMCNRPLGMMTGGIKNSAITASSMWDKYHAPYLARLNARRMGRYQSAWSARLYKLFYCFLHVHKIYLQIPRKPLRVQNTPLQ